ncbi:MAG: hypothetical protein ACKVOH_00270 [Chlamydiales bacterium]
MFLPASGDVPMFLQGSVVVPMEVKNIRYQEVGTVASFPSVLNIHAFHIKDDTLYFRLDFETVVTVPCSNLPVVLEMGERCLWREGRNIYVLSSLDGLFIDKAFLHCTTVRERPPTAEAQEGLSKIVAVAVDRIASAWLLS